MAGRLGAYATAATLIRLADEGARVALALLALQRLGNVAVGGVLVAVLLVPHVVAAPVVGWLTDRAARPRLLVAAAAVGFGASLMLTGAVLGRLPLAVALGVLLLGGCCGPALTGGLSSQLPALLPPDRLPRGFGVDALSYNLAGIAGPALAGVLATATSAAVATLALGASAVVGAALVAALPTRRRTAVRMTDNLTAAVRTFAREPVLGAVAGATTLSMLGTGALPVFLTVAAVRAAHPAGGGLVLAATAFGGLLGSLAWTWRPAGSDRAPAVVMASLVGVGVPILAAAAHPSLPVLLALFTLSGVADGPLFGALLLTRHRYAPEAVRTQVFTLSAGAKISASAAGAALAGTATTLATGTQLAAAGAVPVLAGLLGALALRARHPDEPVTAAVSASRGRPGGRWSR